MNTQKFKFILLIGNNNNKIINNNNNNKDFINYTFVNTHVLTLSNVLIIALI